MEGFNSNMLLGVLAGVAAVFLLSYHYAKRLLDWLHFQSIGTRDYIVDRLQQMFIKVEPEKVLLAQIVIAVVPTILVMGWVIQKDVFGAVFVGALTAWMGWKAPKPIIDYMYRRRVDKMVAQMMDALALMANGLKSSLSISQAMELVSSEMPNPIQQEFDQVLKDNQFGLPLEEAFVNMSKRVQADEVEMFVTAVNILKETGGNLAETFDTISGTIRERFKVENRIKALTAQGFSQGIMLLFVPPMLGAFLYQSDPQFMAPLFNHFLGWILIIFVLILELVAFFVILKVTTIKV